MLNKAKLTKREYDIVENIRKEYEEHDSNIGKEIWYAIQSEAYKEWDDGEHDIFAAAVRLKEAGEGNIAIIDVEDNFCLGGFDYADVF